MTPSNIQLDSHVSGDTWQGIPVIGPILNGTEAMPVAAASARLTLAKSGSRSNAFTLGSTGTVDAPITLVNGADWSFVIPEVSKEVWTPPPGTYTGHFEVTDTAGAILTVYQLTLQVLSDLT